MSEHTGGGHYLDTGDGPKALTEAAGNVRENDAQGAYTRLPRPPARLPAVPAVHVHLRHGQDSVGRIPGSPRPRLLDRATTAEGAGGPHHHPVPSSEVGSRLHARNLRPDDISVGTPLKPTTAKLLDLMTKDRLTSDTEAGSKAVDAVEGADDQGELPDLGEIADSGRLDNPQDLREILPTTDKVDNQRVLQQIALLLQADPQAHVTWTAPSTTAGATPPADYLYTTTEQGRPVKRAVQAETVRSPAELGSQARLGAAQLNGEQPDSGTGGGQEVRSGYERVPRLDLEPFVGPLLDLATTQDLEHSLSTSPPFQQLRDSLCEPNGGGPRVDRLVIVNASGTHQWTSPRQIGASCGSGGASPSPDPSSSSGPDDKPTCLTQSPPAGVVETSGAGWIYYAPTGSHKRATAATACLKNPLGDGYRPGNALLGACAGQASRGVAGWWAGARGQRGGWVPPAALAGRRPPLLRRPGVCRGGGA